MLAPGVPLASVVSVLKCVRRESRDDGCKEVLVERSKWPLRNARQLEDLPFRISRTGTQLSRPLALEAAEKRPPLLSRGPCRVCGVDLCAIAVREWTLKVP